MPVAEAPFRETAFGLVADVDGWFVLNARDSRWRGYGPLGASCNFEGKRPFRQVGFNINVLEPEQPLGAQGSRLRGGCCRERERGGRRARDDQVGRGVRALPRIHARARCRDGSLPDL